MLKIERLRMVEENGVKVCDALLLDGDKFACFIQRYEDEYMLEYSASDIPYYEHFFTEEEFIGFDYTEQYVFSQDPSLVNSEGFEDSKYLKGYKALDKYMREYLAVEAEGVHQVLLEDKFI